MTNLDPSKRARDFAARLYEMFSALSTSGESGSKTAQFIRSGGADGWNSVQLFAEFEAALTPMTPLVLDREAVARIISPTAWRKFDEVVADAFCWRSDRDASLAKADSIIALTSQAGGLVEAERERCAKIAEKIGECANTSGRGSCCEITGQDIASAIRASNPSVGGGV